MPPRSAVRSLLLHGMSFALPALTLGYLLTAPHSGGQALLFIGVVLAAVYADHRAPAATHQPSDALPPRAFDGILYGLFGLQLVNLWLAFDVVSGCDCRQGCPACVGTVEEVGALGKETAQRVLAHMSRGADLVPSPLPVVDEAMEGGAP